MDRLGISISSSKKSPKTESASEKNSGSLTKINYEQKTQQELPLSISTDADSLKVASSSRRMQELSLPSSSSDTGFEVAEKKSNHDNEYSNFGSDGDSDSEDVKSASVELKKSPTLKLTLPAQKSRNPKLSLSLFDVEESHDISSQISSSYGTPLSQIMSDISTQSPAFHTPLTNDSSTYHFSEHPIDSREKFLEIYQEFPMSVLQNHGSSGAIRVIHNKLNKEFILKSITLEKARGATFQEKVENIFKEAFIQNAAADAGVAPRVKDIVYFEKEQMDDIHIVMEQVQGIDLKEFIYGKSKVQIDEVWRGDESDSDSEDISQSKSKPILNDKEILIPEPNVKKIIFVLLQQLNKLHHLSIEDESSEIFHLDLKPANIMITSEGKDALELNENFTTNHLKLVDFGVSVFREKGSTKSLLAGREISPVYRHPNFLELHETDKEIPCSILDLHAVGLIMLELLTGQRFNQQVKIGDFLIPQYDLLDQISPEARKLVDILLNYEENNPDVVDRNLNTNAVLQNDYFNGINSNTQNAS